MVSTTSATAKPPLPPGHNMAPSSIQQRHQQAALEENQRAKSELQTLLNRIQNQRRQHAVTQFQCIWRRYCAKKKLEELFQESSAVPRSKRGPLLDASPLKLETAREKFRTATHLSNFRPVPQQQENKQKITATVSSPAPKTFVIDTKSVISPAEYLFSTNDALPSKGFTTPPKGQGFLPPPPLVMLTPDASCSSRSTSSYNYKSGFPPRHTPPSSISSHDEDHAHTTSFETTSSSKMGMFKMVEHAAIVLQSRTRTMLAIRRCQKLMEERKRLCPSQLDQQPPTARDVPLNLAAVAATPSQGSHPPGTMSVIITLDRPSNHESQQENYGGEDDGNDDDDDDVNTSDSSMITERVGNLFNRVVDNTHDSHDSQVRDSPIHHKPINLFETVKQDSVTVVLDSAISHTDPTKSFQPVQLFQPIKDDSDSPRLPSPKKTEDHPVKVLYPVAENTDNRTPITQGLVTPVDDNHTPVDWVLDSDRKKLPVTLVKPCHSAINHDYKDNIVPDIKRITQRVENMEPVYHNLHHRRRMEKPIPTPFNQTTVTTTTTMKEAKKISHTSWAVLLRRIVMGVSLLCLLIATAHHPTTQILMGRRVKHRTLFAEISKKRGKK